MQESMILSGLVAELSAAARRLGLNDTQWCQAAGVRNETLSRLRKRENCDLGTLLALAHVVGASLSLTFAPAVATSDDGHFPARVDRDYEARLIDLAASGDYDARSWRACGPAFFMAGLAVMLASARGLDRRRLLALAEALHPGSSQVDVFSIWLALSPVRPSRFLPMLEQQTRRAA